MRNASLSKSAISKQAGFTLVEIAVTLLVIGIFIAAAIPLYSLYIQYMKRQETIVAQKHVDIALTSFKNLRGRYPCPARYDALPGDADYGKETACNGSTVTPGNCTNGICYEISERTVNVGGTMVTPRVERGSVPFVTLGLNESMAYDGYGGRFSYAVTELLTNSTTFRVSRGGISIVDKNIGTPNSVIEPAGSAHYFVYSHGPDRVGAYNRNGIQIIPCKGPMYDNENCNTDSAHSTARYVLALQSTVDIVDTDGAIAAANPSAYSSGNTHFDDFVRYVGIGTSPPWEIAEDSAGNLLDTANLHDSVPLKKVMIGNDATLDITVPTEAEITVLVEGDTKIQDISKIQTICDPTKGNCMEPVLVGADDPADPKRLHCATAGQIAKGVSNNQLDCQTPQFEGCGPGEYLYGIDASGKPMCRSQGPKCNAQTETLCGTSQTLPGNTKSGTIVVLSAGDSYTETWQCNSGNWELQSSAGLCTCTPSTVTTSSGSCGANMSGTVSTTTTTVCPSGQQTTTTDKSACVCVPSTNTRTVNCPANQSGAITYQDTVTCVNNVPTTTTTLISNTCACVVNTKNRKINCPSGFTGKINQQQVSQCPSGTWGPWTNVSDTCNCKAPYTQTKSCGSAYNSGAITETCTYDCSGGIGQAAPANCTQTQNTCTCNAGSKVTYKSCGSGYTGQIKVTSTTTCPGNVTTTTQDTSACQEIVSTCKVKITDNTIMSNTKQTWQAGDTCTYTASNNPCASIKFCSKLVVSGVYNSYFCSCE